MLPSTGYFKGINCPFYDSGLCERPYCHFRHVKKESQNIGNESIESGAILKLVSAAVQRVLQQTETPGGTENLTNASDTATSKTLSVSSKVTYNPTPISELNKINNTDSENNEDANEQRKRHIPVPYTPRKPATLPIKRPVDTNGSKLFTYMPPVKYTPGSTESTKLDPYTPEGTTESKEKYLPGSEAVLQEYKPDETQSSQSNKVNYVPSDKCSQKKKILEYKPAKVSVKNDIPSVTYQPTPRSLAPCFSSDEEEPNTKKRKVSSDLNGLDDLGPEFDILDQILDEEREIKTKSNEKHHSSDSKHSNHSSKKDSIKKDSKITENINNSKSSEQDRKKTSDKKNKLEKTKTDRKEKESDREKDKKTKSSDKTSSHKSAGKDRVREDKKEKHSSTHKKDSKSKSSNDNAAHSKSHSSKHSEKYSKHSNNSKDETKRKHDSNHHSDHKHSKESKHRDRKKSKEKTVAHLSDDDTYDADVTVQNDDELLSESDEETITEECKKIFEEYVPLAKTKDTEEITNKFENLQDNEEYIPTKKRISRTIDKNIKTIPKAPLKPDFKVNAAQAMAERLSKVREFHASKSVPENKISETVSKPEVNKATFTAPISSNSKIRIAHVPYASTLLYAKKTITPNVSQNEPTTSATAIQTVKKGTQRVAHIPNDKFIDRPGVLEPLGSKIPANIRSTYLNMMIDQCIKIYLSATDAYARAQHEELTTSKKCSTVQIYKNSAVLAVSRLKKELLECNGVKKSSSDCVALQKIPQSGTGITSAAGSWSIESKNKKNLEDIQQFTGAKLYNNIKKWILTEQQLQDNGFPRLHNNGEKGRAIIYGQNKQKPPKGYVRTCCRCKKDYTVDKKGFAAVKEECIYHPNNKYRVRGEARYQCCSQDGSSDGCCVAPSHVYEYVDFENLKGYIKTFPPSTVMDDYGIYSLDCEMCYTTQGLDLTRVTVINSACKVVYETLIRPRHPIIDYNTRYSGITEEQMTHVKTSLLEVQATLLTMFNSNTILIGHSLESDFKALKLIHDTVIDTSVLFPHKMGPPYKRALRNLSSEYLKKIIQNSVDGHDSAEDATVCMELVLYKLKEDLKTR